MEGSTQLNAYPLAGKHQSAQPSERSSIQVSVGQGVQVMNEKMAEYLAKQFEDQGDTILQIRMRIGDQNPLLDNVMHLMKVSRWIEHAVMESESCDHCMSIGLIDPPKEPEGANEVICPY